MNVSAELLEQYILTGLMIGVIYIVMALGITFIYSIMKMTNWAMGEFYMVGSYVQYLVVSRILGADLWFLAVPIAAITVFFLGMAVQRILIRPMFERGMERRNEYATIVTIALALFARGIVQVWAGPFERTPGSNMPSFQLGPLPIAGDRVAACIGGIVALAVFWFVIRRTWVGLALRAAAQSRAGVQTAGVDILRLDQVAFGIGVALAAVAGALLASVYLVYPLNGMVTTTKGFEVVIIGGLGSIPGAIVGGIAVGLAEALGAALLATNYQNAYGFVLVLIILLLRPRTGLFGETTRVA
ncbi:MAG TPA: branched-chain amino acid ABC transporter permease [Candidatus Limnocylindria bacterium]|nr:branched-chain amino acid ABC transporter permease [Candidatus Limnocylindria bacterium]